VVAYAGTQAICGTRIAYATLSVKEKAMLTPGDSLQMLACLRHPGLTAVTDFFAERGKL
jgi:hypothetical protein